MYGIFYRVVTSDVRHKTLLVLKNSGTSYKTSDYKPLHITLYAHASYKTMVSYEAMGIKHFIQLTIKKSFTKR